MAHRFHFDLQNGRSTIRDPEGVQARDLDQAIEEAGSVLEEMRDSDESSEVGEGWNLIIRDAAGEALMTMPVVQPSRVFLAAFIASPAGIAASGFFVGQCPGLPLLHMRTGLKAKTAHLVEQGYGEQLLS